MNVYSLKTYENDIIPTFKTSNLQMLHPTSSFSSCWKQEPEAEESAEETVGYNPSSI